ncbi:hypothetical protein MARINON1_50589 [Marinobacter salarius]|nr:hypothetical protein MBHK15_131021 [Marinobacter salarius]VXB50324.1 hypothetical protein MARINON1_50589 [Marinobacter salarius]
MGCWRFSSHRNTWSTGLSAFTKQISPCCDYCLAVSVAAFLVWWKFRVCAEQACFVGLGGSRRFGGWGYFFFGKKNSLRSDTFFLAEKITPPPKSAFRALAEACPGKLTG